MSDDHFVMQLNVNESNESSVSSALQQVGAIEVKSE